MKKSLFIGLFLTFSLVAFPQKRELKKASKSIDKANFTKAENLLEKAKSLALADDETAVEYHFLRGKLFAEKAKRDQELETSIGEAGKSFMEAEKISKKYADEITKLRDQASYIASKKVEEFYNARNYKKIAPIYESLYRLIPADTSFLYEAATFSRNIKDYDNALKYYSELKNIGYNNVGMRYTAVDKEDRRIVTFSTKKELDKALQDYMLRPSSYFYPKHEKIFSKKGKIIRDIALIYMEQGKKEKALNLITEARKSNSENADLVMGDALIHFLLGNKNKFEDLMEEAAILGANDAELLNAMGIFCLEQGYYRKAEKFFKKVDILANFPDTYLNIARAQIGVSNELADIMNSLGNTDADNKKYNGLKDIRNSLFSNATYILWEEYKRNEKTRAHTLEQLKNIYAAWGDTANFKRVEDLLASLKPVKDMQ